MNARAIRSFVVGAVAAVALVAVGCTTTSSPPAAPSSPKLVAAGGTHSCAVDQNRQVICWGQNARGQLGIGSFVDSPAPRFVPGMSNATAVTASLTHSCAIRQGAVFCWGGNTDGQIGDGTTVDRPSPVQVPGLADIVQIGTGLGHSCARDVAGVVQLLGRQHPGPARRRHDDGLPDTRDGHRDRGGRVDLGQGPALLRIDDHVCGPMLG